MSSNVRAAFGVVILAVALFWYPPTNHFIAKKFDQFLDLADARPTETVLFLGNSRTSQNDLPYLVRKMADSAGAPVRYDMTLAAWDGASFEALANNADVQQLLKQHWDHVFLQAESRAHGDAMTREKFQKNGMLLVAAASAQQSPAALIVNWVYSTKVFADLNLGGSPEDMRSQYLGLILDDHRQLAQQSGARLVNTALAWEYALSRDRNLPLYRDGNHPTVAGSYLAALTVYAFLSQQGVSKVTYVPQGLSDEMAAKLREAVR